MQQGTSNQAAEERQVQTIIFLFPYFPYLLHILMITTKTKSHLIKLLFFYTIRLYYSSIVDPLVEICNFLCGIS